MENPITMIIGLLLIAIIALALLSLVRHLGKSKRTPDGDAQTERVAPHRESLHVTVIDQYCSVQTVGSKSPRTVKTFTVRLQDDDGNIRTLSLPEKLYDAFEAGQRGTLTLVDGELYGFSLDGDPKKEDFS